MRPSSLAGHALELIEILQRDQHPANHIIDTFFRQHRYLGSHDRRELAESIYGILRHLRLLQALLPKSNLTLFHIRRGFLRLTNCILKKFHPMLFKRTL
jgi:hypothetical protein